MDTPTTDFVRAGSVEELKAKGRLKRDDFRLERILHF